MSRPIREILIVEPRGNPVRALEPRLDAVHVDRTEMLPTVLIGRLRNGDTDPPAVTVYRADGAVVLDELVAELYASAEAAQIVADTGTWTERTYLYADTAHAWKIRLAAFLAAPRSS